MKTRFLSSSLFLSIFALLGIGLVQVYSASYIFATESYDDGLYFFKRQFIFTIIAFATLILTTQIPFEKIIWEAPQKAQQVWFIKLLGANVNLGNIAPEEVIPLETIRLGLRGDTFLHFLGLERKKDNSAPPFQID